MHPKIRRLDLWTALGGAVAAAPFYLSIAMHHSVVQRASQILASGYMTFKVRISCFCDANPRGETASPFRGWVSNNS